MPNDEIPEVQLAEFAVRAAENRVACQLSLLNTLEAKGYPEAVKARELLGIMTKNLQLTRYRFLFVAARHRKSGTYKP
jgi:hypothetical protein